MVKSIRKVKISAQQRLLLYYFGVVWFGYIGLKWLSGYRTMADCLENRRMSASIQCCVLRMLCVFCCTVSFTFQSIIVINFGTPRLYENVFRHYELSDLTSHLQFCTSLRSDGRHSVVPKVKSIETIMRSCHSALSARLRRYPCWSRRRPPIRKRAHAPAGRHRAATGGGEFAAARARLTSDIFIGNESAPIQLAQCRFPRLAISIAKI